MTVWGVVALCCCGFAVLAANVSALIPSNVLAGLHASRLDGGTVNQLRSQVAAVEAETERMRRENNLLMRRFDLAEESQGAVTRRVGALEVSLPHLVERIPEDVFIDNSATASISSGTPLSFEAEGGSVKVEQKPLVTITSGAPVREVEPEVPATADGSAFGVALGFPIEEDDGQAQWQGLMAKVGTLLLGLWPVLSDVEGGAGKMVVAGPIASQTQADQLCGHLDKVGIPCKPVRFEGDPLPLLN